MIVTENLDKSFSSGELLNVDGKNGKNSKGVHREMVINREDDGT